MQNRLLMRIQGHKYQSDCWGSLGCGCKLGRKYKKVTITLNGKKVVLQIGNKNYEVNGQQKQMDTVALLKESRTFVPVRFVSEALEQP